MSSIGRRARTAVLRLGSSSPTFQVLRLRTYLTNAGWVRSRLEGHPCGPGGEPRPWLTMPFIDLVDNRLPKGSRVFEWGSGASTHWFAAAGCVVVSCEHDPDWAARNRDVIHRPLDDGYVEEISRHDPFDLVLIDGRRRVDCMRVAQERLTPGGVIVLDNSDRPRYRAGIVDLIADGFREVPFVGIAPGALKQTTTSVLYRDGNVLDL